MAHNHAALSLGLQTRIVGRKRSHQTPRLDEDVN
jgi:hypothetical protein